MGVCMLQDLWRVRRFEANLLHRSPNTNGLERSSHLFAHRHAGTPDVIRETPMRPLATVANG